MKEIIESYKDINLECDDVLFTEFLDKWLKGIKEIIKPSTWESYDKTVSGKLKPYFESKRYKFKDMKPEVFTKYFVFLSQHGKSIQVQGYEAGGIHQVFCISLSTR